MKRTSIPSMWWGVQETNTDEQKSEKKKSKLYGVEEYPQCGGEYIKPTQINRRGRRITSCMVLKSANQ